MIDWAVNIKYWINLQCKWVFAPIAFPISYMEHEGFEILSLGSQILVNAQYECKFKALTLVYLFFRPEELTFTVSVSWPSVLFQVHVFSAWMGRSAQTWLTAQEAQDRVIPEEVFIRQPPESLILLQQVLLQQGKQAEWEGRQSQGQEAQVCRSREGGRERRRGGTGQERGSWFGCQVPHAALQGWPLRQQGNSSPGRPHVVIMWCTSVCSHSQWFLQMNISRYGPQHQTFAPVQSFFINKSLHIYRVDFLI